LIVELAFLFACLVHMRPAMIGRALEVIAAARRGARHEPAVFLEAVAEASAGLFLELRLTSAHRGDRAMRALLDRLEHAVTPSPKLLALNATTVLAWWPNAAPLPADIRARTFQLHMAAPREIARVKPA